MWFGYSNCLNGLFVYNLARAETIIHLVATVPDLIKYFGV